jgi:hypothetical protein
MRRKKFGATRTSFDAPRPSACRVIPEQTAHASKNNGTNLISLRHDFTHRYQIGEERSLIP